MASPNDQSETAHTLPRPELNPLVNPRLAENMGRWAEVYFTAPPEKREEAVEGLLKELESGSPEPKTKPQPVPYSATDSFPLPEVHPGLSTADAPPFTRCQGCGHDNPDLHQFCGMCGARLMQDFPPLEFEEIPSEHRHFDRGSIASNHASHFATSRMDSQVAAPVHEFDESVEDGKDRDELSHLRRISDSSFGDDDTLHWNLEATSSRPYRVYIGAVLAMVLIVLGYMAWRSSHLPQTTHEALPAVPVATNDGNAQPTVPSSPPPPAATSVPVSKAEVPTAVSPVAQPTAAPSSASAPPPIGKSAETKSSGVEIRPASGNQQTPAQTAISFGGNGAEEFTIAEHYLNGSNGVQRNASEAVPWLWKSVAKHYSAALVPLGDRYAKGDGVPKNCDQARILYDSAARKGVVGAGERLRYLPAFGCQ